MNSQPDDRINNFRSRLPMRLRQKAGQIVGLSTIELAGLHIIGVMNEDER